MKGTVTRDDRLELLLNQCVVFNQENLNFGKRRFSVIALN